MKIRFYYFGFFLQVLFVSFYFLGSSWADDEMPAWKEMPGVVLVVDKSRQKLFVCDAQKRTVLREAVCTTGQVKGDKLAEGDLRTPEGVYFIESGIDSGLDFELYGGQALVLNFPNPVDRAAQKTGHGIWIHGRGRLIVPRDTKGCVAMDNESLSAVKRKSQLGWTPVFIVRSLPVKEQICSAKDLSVLLGKTNEWARKWSGKSEDFFACYDAQAYDRIAGRSFADFAAKKRKLFDRYAWIHVFLSAPRVVCAGPYAVTYFGQLYRAPGHSFEGIKRLYWQKDKNGDWKIIGEEWRKKDLGLRKKYQEQRQTKLLAWLESWRQAWERGNLKKYGSYYQETAVQGPRRGLEAIYEQKKKIWSKAMPVKVELKDIQIRDLAGGVAVRAIQTFTDTGGYHDQGIKELVLRPDGEKRWKIVREDWKKQ